MIEVHGLRKRFGAVEALAGIDLHVPAGTLFGLLGPDGAGKTTTLRCLAGVLAPDGGQVRVAGQDPASPAARRRLGYVTQPPGLYGDLTAQENIAFFGRVYGLEPGVLRERVRELLDFTGLGPFAGRLADHLSGGMRQKLALACALVHEPDVLLLDEPTTGIDPLARRDFWTLLTRLRDRGLAAVVSTPQQDEAQRCDRLAFLWRGRLLAEGTPEEVRRLAPPGVLRLTGTPLAALRRVAAGCPSVRVAYADARGVTALGDDPERMRAEIEEGLVRAGLPATVAPATAVLEDALIALTVGGEEA